MLVVLLAAALLPLSSAQSTDEDSVQQTQGSDSDLSSTEANSGSTEEPESAPSVSEEPSANSGNGEEQQLQEPLEVESDESSDITRNDLENQQGEGNVEQDQNEPPPSPDYPPGQPQQVYPSQNPSPQSA